MPRPRIDTRKIREVLRLALGEELSRRQGVIVSRPGRGTFVRPG